MKKRLHAIILAGLVLSSASCFSVQAKGRSGHRTHVSGHSRKITTKRGNTISTRIVHVRPHTRKHK